MLDELMQFVARTQKLCCSPMLLEFLGVRKPERAAQTTITVTEKIFEEEKSEDVSMSVRFPFLTLIPKHS